MGKLKILTALLLAAALTACGDDSDVFYTTSYPVARIEVSVSLSEPEKPDPENPDPENPDPENPDPTDPTDPDNPGGDIFGGAIKFTVTVNDWIDAAEDIEM